MENAEKHKKPIDYSKGKIYRIVCDTTGLTYIGSTIEALSKRLSGHRGNYKSYLKGKTTFVTSFNIIKNDNYKIILIDNYPCNSKEELEREERKYIESIKCVNKNVPGRIGKEYQKEYYENNKDKIKEYYENNKEKIKEYKKEYNENNKEKIKESNKEYRENNKEKILKKNKIKIECEYCKSFVTPTSLKRHQKSLKCIEFQKNL